MNVIAIDHGNKNTKVLGKDENNLCFTSGYVESDIEPIVKENLLIYNGKYYSIGSNRFSTTFDKSADDRFFKLTLAAIAHNLNTYSIQSGNVVLAVGLPIASFGVLKHKFREYFVRDNITFNYNGKDYRVNIKDCYVFPQGYSAILSKAGAYKDIGGVCIDIGGYTTDIFIIEKGLKLDVSSAISLNNGVIKLFKNIQQELIKKDIKISERQIEDALRNSSPIFFHEDVVSIINQKAEEYIDNLLDEVKESGYEIKINPSIFIGGGAMLLRKYIENNKKVGYSEFLDEYSNCRGYEILAKKAMQKKDE